MNQEEKAWNKYWGGMEIAENIKDIDRTDIRPLILKYISRKGKTLEAGCGFGRWVFYLSDLGIDIIGSDISEEGLKLCENWAKKNDYKVKFEYGDVENLKYKDNSFSGYISLGVVEHFKNGPLKAIKESYRVLRPGGIAIIYTPNKCLYWKFDKLVNLAKKIGKREKEFVQYEFSLNELADFAKKAGFEIIEKQNRGLVYYPSGLSKTIPGAKFVLRPFGGIIVRLCKSLDKTALRRLGAMSIVIAYKPGKMPHCFFCGEIFNFGSIKDSKYDVPVCEKCAEKLPKIILDAYKKGRKNDYKTYCGKRREHLKCHFCNKEFRKNKRFGNYGFSVDACPACLKEPLKNLELGNYYLEYCKRL